jgi:hypothetical protein
MTVAGFRSLHRRSQPKAAAMPVENEPVSAEKMRKKQFVATLGQCQECGHPVLEGQAFLRTESGIRHALCSFDPAFAKRERDGQVKIKQ